MDEFLQRIVAAMRANEYRLDTKPGEVNIVYVEGVGINGTPNDNAPDKWNDVRCVFGFENEEPFWLGQWIATTEPGKFFTENPLNPSKGAARIAFGQRTAWPVGKHNAGKRSGHEALVQRVKIPVHRDLNEDYDREGDKVDVGLFGINQHHGYDLSVLSIGKAGAGCLVGQSKAGHREFMRFVKSDPRYIADNEFIFTTTIMSADELE